MAEYKALLASGRYFEYYCQRNRLDLYVKRQIEQATQMDSYEMIGTVWSLLEHGERLVPLLVAEIRRFERNCARRAVRLKRFYIYSLLLRALRSQRAFEFVYKTVKEKEDDLNVEEAFYKLSYFDPSFDNLVRFRKAILSRLQSDARAYQEKEKPADPDVVVYILHRFFQLLSHIFYSEIDKHYEIVYTNFAEVIEDNFLLKVYCGEATGSAMLVFSIALRVAKALGIPCMQCKLGLMVLGKCVTFSKGRVSKVSARKMLARFLSFHRGPDYHSALSDHLRQITSRDVLESCLAGTRPLLKEVVVIPGLEGLSYEALDSKLFPHLKCLVPTEYLRYLSAYYQLLKYGDEDKNGAFPDFKRLLMAQFFTDYPILKKRWPLQDQTASFFKQFEDDFKRNYNREILQYHGLSTRVPNSSPATFVEGTVVRQTRAAKYGVILAQHRTVAPISDTPYYFVYLCQSRGMVGVRSHAGLVQCTEVPADAIEELTADPLIGLFFNRFDKSVGKFVKGSVLSENA